jgi:hypothetical protein
MASPTLGVQQGNTVSVIRSGRAECHGCACGWLLPISRRCVGPEYRMRRLSHVLNVTVRDE